MCYSHYGWLWVTQVDLVFRTTGLIFHCQEKLMLQYNTSTLTVKITLTAASMTKVMATQTATTMQYSYPHDNIVDQTTQKSMRYELKNTIDKGRDDVM